jgi:predicted anti-sigma-YlaC factor YlaD
MKCSIIRDLLPLYEVNKCRRETRKIVSSHLKSCESCRSFYKAMGEEVGLKNSIEVQQQLHQDKEFWCKYYGALLIKGFMIFLLVYSILIGIWVVK